MAGCCHRIKSPGKALVEHGSDADRTAQQAGDAGTDCPDPRSTTSSQMHLRYKVGARCAGHAFVLYTGALVNGGTMLVFELAIVLGLIVLNGFLAMSELALVSARRPLLEQMARHGSRGAAVALDLTASLAGCCRPCRSASPW